MEKIPKRRASHCRKCSISSTNRRDNDYYVLTSTTVALPLINWTPVLTNQFDSSGNFIFTNGINQAEPQRFYLLEVP